MRPEKLTLQATDKERLLGSVLPSSPSSAEGSELPR